jgi:hypothetical protein
VADSRLSWVFELIDKVSGPARQISDKVGDAEKKIHGLSGALEKLAHVTEIFYFGGEILAGFAEKLAALGRGIIDGMRFKQNALIALEAMMGTRDAAIQVFEGVEDFAWKTGQSVRNVMQTTKDLLASNFKPEEVESLRLMLADLKVVDPAKADAVAVAIGEIGRRGEMTERQMRMLSNAGVDESRMWEELSKRLGQPVAALKAIDGLRVKAGTAVAAIFDVVVKKWDKGVVGTLAEKEAKTLPALIDKVRAIPERIFDALAGFEHGAGGGMFEKILTNVADAFDPTKPSGMRVIQSIRSLIDYVGSLFGITGPGGLFGELAGENGAARVEQIFQKLVNFMREDVIPTMKTVAETISAIANAIRVTGEFLSWFNKGMPEYPGEDLTPAGRATAARRQFAEGTSATFSPQARERLLQATIQVDVKGDANRQEAHEGAYEGTVKALEMFGIQVGGTLGAAAGTE